MKEREEDYLPCCCWRALAKKRKGGRKGEKGKEEFLPGLVGNGTFFYLKEGEKGKRSLNLLKGRSYLGRISARRRKRRDYP